jgi:hypothetical protein
VIVRFMSFCFEDDLPMDMFVIDATGPEPRGFLTVREDEAEGGFRFVTIEAGQLSHLIRWFRGFFEPKHRHETPARSQWIDELDLRRELLPNH